MCQIEDDKGVVVCLLAFEADTISASPRRDICAVNADIHEAVIGIDEPVTLGGRLVDVVDVSTGGVGFCLKVEHGEKVRSAVVILEDIASYTEVCQAGRDKKSKECGEVHIDKVRVD